MIERSSGILLPISSLPSNYGIGTLGIEAYNFVDFLKESKQKYWQVLPLNPTSFGDSPYSPFSSFAGNPYLIDLDLLVKNNLLKNEDLKDLKGNENEVDYGYLYETRFNILYKAYLNGKDNYSNKIKSFIRKNNWVKDYALFMALKKHFKMISWIDWPEIDIRKREEKAIKKYQKLLKDDIDFYIFIQVIFFEQLNNLRKYLKKKKIRLIGDLPIYVSLDSADCWANPKCFKLDEDLKPIEVSGVPPDYFTEDGQLWGNPLYDWDYLKKDNYKWWLDRIKAASNIYDVIRLDHFIGFESYWAVKYGEKTARNGHRYKGPGIEFINLVKEEFKGQDFIVEDLGVQTPEIVDMVKKANLPNMKILQFGFAREYISEHSPIEYEKNQVVYLGTHDNETIKTWYKNLNKKDKEYIKDYLDVKNDDDINDILIKEGMKSRANLFICQLQDYLGLDDRYRTNLPGTLGINWKYRALKKDFSEDLKNKIKHLTLITYRNK